MRQVENETDGEIRREEEEGKRVRGDNIKKSHAFVISQFCGFLWFFYSDEFS